MQPTQIALRQLGTVKRCLRFSLQGDAALVYLALVLSVDSEEEHRLGVKAQVVPCPLSLQLPPNLHLRLWSSGHLLQDSSSNLVTQCLEIPYFRGNFGETFRLEVQLDHDAFQASFQL